MVIFVHQHYFNYTVLKMVSLSDAYKAASEKKPNSLEILCNFWRENEGTTPIVDQRGNTILHFLAIHGNIAAIKMLDKHGLLTTEQLKKCNANGEIALHEAARFGHKDVAETMLEKEGDLINARNELGETPIYVAAAFGNRDVFDFFSKICDDEWLMGLRTRDGCTVLHAAVKGEYYRLAVNILESYPKLADKRDEKGIPSMVIDSEIVGDVEDPRGSAHDISKSEGALLSKLMSGYRRIIRVFPWIKQIDDARQKHVFARELAKRLIEEENGWSDYLNCKNFHVSGLGCFGETSSQNKKNRVIDPLILATKHGIHEMVEEILEKFPNVATTFDENGRNILHMAAQLKDRILYDYLKKTVNHADRMMADVDKHGNTILHLTAYECKQGHFLTTHFGPVNRMSWDVFWFKRVQNDSHPHLIYHRNIEGKTPKELFEEEHEDMINKAEKVVKDINSCLMLVSTLIGTVNYAALFTVPGGFDQDKGLPIFFTKAKNGREDLQLFMVYVGGSLVASLLGLGTQLSIQVSRFNSNDFHISLPMKFLYTITSLFYAAAFSITACFQIFIIEGAFINSYFAVMVLACIFMTLVYTDALYLTYDYLYYVIRYSLAYRGQKM
ncbi:ankyrin repeat-containing protein ITN1-like isoform X4 [Camellia sinensis]|uniref:ankyrin repeat-containing protein ITN1-like isoform X4 n=1 Tax=Camellia sinensis TaxID=4442 RepID=UPI0010366B05|nr:ankyrin repeat-containing protein ITN1-like isoform X4 [Camellia sinensis]